MKRSFSILCFSSLFIFLGCAKEGKPLIHGGERTAEMDCEQSFILDAIDAFDSICQAIPWWTCDFEKESFCNTYEREVFTGTTINYIGTDWNTLGGRGKVTQEAALCALRDLKTAPYLTKARAADFGSLGEIALTQELGFKSWDAAEKKFEGYKKLQACLPALGCFDLTSTELTFTGKEFDNFGYIDGKRYYDHSLWAGGHQIAKGFSLEVKTSESEKLIDFDGEPIEIPTVIGPFYVTPKFHYETSNVIISSPYIGSTYTLETKLTPFYAEINSRDVYGRTRGMEATENDGYAVGWNSQLGIGQRGGELTWSPFESHLRPDLDMNQPRNTPESSLNFKASMGAELSYSPTNLIPDWMKQSPLKLHFLVSVRPELSASGNDQLHVYASEVETPSPPDFNPRHYTKSDLQIKTRTKMNVKFDVYGKLELNVKVRLGSIPFAGTIEKTLVNIKEDLSQELYSEDIKKEGDKKIQATSYSVPGVTRYVAPEIDLLTTFNRLVEDPKEFVEDCMQVPFVEEEDVPAPSANGDDPAKLFSAAVWACNICVGFTNSAEGYDEEGNYHEYNKRYTVANPVNRYGWGAAQDSWRCDHVKKIGCHDLCQNINGQLYVIKTAAEIERNVTEGESMRCDAAVIR